MWNGTFPTVLVSISPSIYFAHLVFSPNKSHQHLSLFMSLCHLRSVLSVHGIVWHHILQQAQHKEHCTKWQFSSKELISFLNVISIHHRFGSCIPALKHEWTAPCKVFGRSHWASSLAPDFTLISSGTLHGMLHRLMLGRLQLHGVGASQAPVIHACS